ncbi:anaerobic ribonucleoside-triphosphate reductase [Patescibacteria group bacterium]|nr:anaerobic ribonucleoside-triphosphate reductase [Patescibacteria group bacterium]
MAAAKTKKRQECEVYSRVVGYLRPISQWNDGKGAEFEDRLEYNAKLNA